MNKDNIHREILQMIIKDVYPISLMDDFEYDPSDRLLYYRKEFNGLQATFDILLAGTKSCTQTLNKEFMNIFKCNWESTLKIALNFPVSISLPIDAWLPVVWLQIIGCPQNVHCVEDFIYLV